MATERMAVTAAVAAATELRWRARAIEGRVAIHHVSDSDAKANFQVCVCVCVRVCSVCSVCMHPEMRV